MTTRMVAFGAIMILVLATPIATAQGTGSVYRLLVDGLACPFCAYGVEKQLSRVDGVERIDTDISTGTVTITMMAGRELDESVARRAVEAAAFTLRGFQRDPTAGRPRAKE